MKDSQSWLLIGESVIGSSHLVSKLPCQDSNFYLTLDQGWGIAVVADGAGSAQKSDQGSAYVAENASNYFKILIEEKGWQSLKELPSDKEWQEEATKGLFTVFTNLCDFAKQQNIPVASLASTIIVLIYSPMGILLTHIGDGRAAFANEKNEWKAVMEPWKGEYANETVFLTSDIWQSETDKFVMTNVLREKPSAFALMTDGFERYAYEVSIWNEEEEKYCDPNRPFARFFEPLLKNLVNMHTNKVEVAEMKEKWKKFLNAGNDKIKSEPDDKTMILGVAL